MQKISKQRTESKTQLFITHFECSPDEITKILGISPTATWRKNDPIPKSTGGVRKVNGWRLESPVKPTASPEGQINSLLEIVAPNINRFKQLPTPSEVELSCAIYAYDESQRVFGFSLQTVQLLAKMNATIGVAYYDLRK